MDSASINSITKFILQSNMSDFNIKHVNFTPVTCYKDEEGKIYHTVKSCISDTFFSQKGALSESWVAGNLLIFTLFDGFLENKYGLTEGESFKNHYTNLPEITFLDIVSKNCYRIMKVIRNAIQHNLSSVVYNDGSYTINYQHHNTIYNLEISADGVNSLYTLILNIVQCRVMDMPKTYYTTGHYEGILNTQYKNVESGISNFSDDISGSLLNLTSAQNLRANERRVIENPYIISENETSIVFHHIEPNMTNDENSKQYYYSTDYMYSDYLLPQEVGTITWGEGTSLQEKIKNATISFDKKNLVDKWKIQSN